MINASQITSVSNHSGSAGILPAPVACLDACGDGAHNLHVIHSCQRHDTRRYLMDLIYADIELANAKNCSLKSMVRLRPVNTCRSGTEQKQ